MTWYNKILKNYIKETFSSVSLYLLTAVFLTVWYFYSDQPFHWVWIEPVDVPPYERLLYSALFFAGPGYLLYRAKVYLVLYHLLDFRDFKEIKAIILAGTSWLMYFKIIPWFVNLLNDVISIGYNIFKLLLYIAPSFTLSLIAVFAFLYFRKNGSRLMLKDK